MIHLQNTKISKLLTATTAATTTRSASFDMQGYSYATLVVGQSASAGTNGGMGAVSLLNADSVPTQATQHSTIVADLGTQVTTSHAVVYHVDWKSKKRYGKVILTPNTNTNDSIITDVTLIQSRAASAPSNTAGMIGSTNDVVTLVG